MSGKHINSLSVMRLSRKIIVKFVQWDLGPTESYPKPFSNDLYMHLTVTQERLACAGDNFLG